MTTPGEKRMNSSVPLTMIITRLLFASYFIAAFFAIQSPPVPYSTMSYPWLAYLGTLYLLAERGYTFFKRKKIDLTYSFPLLFANYILNGMTELVGGQERFPLLNRTEHLASFIFLAYIVWTFFTKYLPQAVWRRHRYYTAILVFSVTSTFGVINEIVELVLDSLFGTSLVGSQPDTSLDLLMNSLGAGLFLAVQLIISATEKDTISPST